MLADLRFEALRLGATDLRPSWRKGKKIAVLFQGKWIHAGALGYDDYTTHHDPVRRAAYRKRHRAILLLNGLPAYKDKKQAAFWSWHLLRLRKNKCDLYNPPMETAPTSSIDLLQFAIIVIMALERIIKGFTASPCRHILCKSCCGNSLEIEMSSPRPRSASETARDEKSDGGANQSKLSSTI